MTNSGRSGSCDDAASSFPSSTSTSSFDVDPLLAPFPLRVDLVSETSSTTLDSVSVPFSFLTSLSLSRLTRDEDASYGGGGSISPETSSVDVLSGAGASKSCGSIDGSCVGVCVIC